ncbi:MAG: UbiA family prenyltransferase [Gammaproteobacteria bacterium]|nr:UbiA family prenyltransferase [Gammaproteobacteria bacterium]
MNSGAIILFMILFLWQIPHFYAIAIYRKNDYIAASIPALPIKKGIHCAKIYMLLYITAFTIAAVMPTFFGYTGWLYFIVALCSGLVWFYYGIQGLTTTDNEKWARKMFLFSIINITLLCIMMSVKP